MSATSFDTLAAARRLEAEGMANGQAVAVAETIRDVQADLVTKAHLDSALADFEGRQNVRFAELEGRFVALESGQNAKFAELEGRFVALESGQNAKFAELEGQFVALEGRQNVRFAELEGRFVAVGSGLDAKFAELRADFAEKQAAIYRALWLQGASIIAVFTALYALFGRPV